MGLIQRSFTYMDQHNFIFLIRSLVRPHLKYADAIWSPILKKDIQLIEKVQRRTTRYIPVNNQRSYQEHLEKLDLPTQVLQILRRYDSNIKNSSWSVCRDIPKYFYLPLFCRSHEFF